MKWDDLPDRDKVKLILQHVIPHSMNDNIVFRNNHIDFVKRGREATPFEYPIAAWDDFPPGIWWTYNIGDNGDATFDPLHSLSDAWQIVELDMFSSVEVTKHWQGELEIKEHKYSCHLVMSGIRTHSFGSTPQEAICKAALAAYGVEIE